MSNAETVLRPILTRPPRVGLQCCLLTVATLALCRGGLAGETPQPEENRWETKIRGFEARDAERMPPPGGILFVGSSSIVGWKLEECFPDLPVINRGFGGSHVADSLHFAERIILPYRPKIVVLYAGDNDVAAGKSPQRVLDDFQRLVQKVHDALPNTRILFI